MANTDNKFSTITSLVEESISTFNKIDCASSLMLKAKKLQELEILKNKLQSTLTDIINCIESGKLEIDLQVQEQAKKIAKVKELINSNSNITFYEKNKTHQTHAVEKTWGGIASTNLNKSPIIIAQPNIPTTAMTKLQLAPDVFENAFIIHNEQECHQYKGSLCYVHKTDRFCFSLNDLIIRGKITRILSKEESVLKWRTFDPRLGIDPEGRFYHEDDPKDVHYLTNRMEYFPASINSEKKLNPYTYPLGDRNNLKWDLESLNLQDYSLMNDICGHFTLIYIAAQRFFQQKMQKK